MEKALEKPKEEILPSFLHRNSSRKLKRKYLEGSDKDRELSDKRSVIGFLYREKRKKEQLQKDALIYSLSVEVYFRKTF